MESSIPFHTLVKFFDAKEITNEKNVLIIYHWKIEKNTKLEPQNLSSETYDSNPEIMFTKTNDPNNGIKPHIRIHCNFCHKSNHSVSSCFRRQRREDKEREGNSSPRSKSPVNSFDQYFEAYKNRILPNEPSSSYPVN